MIIAHTKLKGKKKIHTRDLRIEHLPELNAQMATMKARRLLHCFSNPAFSTVSWLMDIHSSVNARLAKRKEDSVGNGKAMVVSFNNTRRANSQNMNRVVTCSNPRMLLPGMAPPSTSRGWKWVEIPSS